MSILFIINRPEFYYSHREPLVKYLISKGHTCHIATGNHTIDGVNTNGKVYSFVYHRAKFSLKSLRGLRRILDDANADTIVSFSPKLNLEVLLIRPLQPVLFCFTGLGKVVHNSLAFNAYRLLFLLRIKSQDRLLVQNRDDRALLTKVTNADSIFLVRGSGAAFVENIAPINKKRLIFVGRLTEDKGIIEFLNLSKVPILNSFEIVCIGGDDPSVSNLRLKELALEYPRVKFLGNLDASSLSKVYLNGGILVLPSVREGLPKVAIEAASFGLAMVLSNVPGCNEFDCDILSIQLYTYGVQSELIEKVLFVSKVYNNSESLLIRDYFKNNFSLNVILPKYENAILSLVKE